MMTLRFVADSTLGKLCKHLRMAGFDCRYDRQPPQADRLRKFSLDEDRIVLTRSRKAYSRLRGRVVFVQADDPADQLRQVVRQLAIRRDDLLPLSRCLCCNAGLTAIQGDDLTGRVPDYVLQHQSDYRRCPRCGRIYWPGSHARRMGSLIEQWFGR